MFEIYNDSHIRADSQCKIQYNYVLLFLKYTYIHHFTLDNKNVVKRHLKVNCCNYINLNVTNCFDIQFVQIKKKTIFMLI